MVSESTHPLNDLFVTPMDSDNISPITDNSNNTAVSQLLSKTAINKKDNLQLINNCIAKVALTVSDYKKDDTHVLPKKYLQQIINLSEMENNLVPGTIKPATVRSRVRRNNLEGIHKRRIPIFNSIEPLMVQWCLKMAEIGQSLSRENVIELVNDLIKNTEFEQKYLAYLEECNQQHLTSNGIIGHSWYNKFMKSNKQILHCGRCRPRDINRYTWCTYENFANMYEGVYSSMVNASIAELLEEEIMYNKIGEITINQEEMFGRPTKYKITRPTKYKITRPDYLLFVDKTGCNTNMKEDGFAGGQLFVLPVDMSSQSGRNCATTDIHFTVLCFTSATGEPVLCAVILKSSQEITYIPLSWKMGIDIRRDIVTGETRYGTFEANYGEGRACTGGSKCKFNPIELPCFVGCSPKASITSEMLAEKLKLIDSHDVYKRTNCLQPLLVLDGHHSRMKLPFLQYINDPDHPWTVCLGAPYGTHIWQVADSSKLNGSFKIALSQAKAHYLSFQQSDNQRFVPTDIITLITIAWHKSFGKVKTARNAVIDRGWAPLTYVLLDHPDLRRCKETTKNNHQVLDDNEDENDITITESQDSSTLTFLINNTGTAMSSMLDKMIAKQSKSLARKVNFDEQIQQKSNKQKAIDLLANVTSVTSGQLAMNDCWTLCPGLLQKVKEKEDAKERKRLQCEIKKQHIILFLKMNLSLLRMLTMSTLPMQERM